MLCRLWHGRFLWHELAMGDARALARTHSSYNGNLQFLVDAVKYRVIEEIRRYWPTATRALVTYWCASFPRRFALR